MSDHEHDLPALDPRIIASAAEGCEESRILISRRGALGLSAGFFTWAFTPRVAEARSSDPRLLIVVLRGGMDGLNVAVPVGDPQYETLRGKLALAKENLLLLNDYFYLHRSLGFFKTLYDAGQASIVHAIAPPMKNRSHFECQRNLENGTPGDKEDNVTGGWLNRLLSKLAPADKVKVGALQIGPTPLILQGSEKVLSWSPTLWPRPVGFDASLLDLYKSTDKQLHDLLTAGIAANTLATSTSGPALPANASSLQRSFRGAAKLLGASNGGARIAVLNVEGWDTHIGQSQALAANLTDLDRSLSDFTVIARNSGYWNDTVVLFVTEFGRTAKGNSDNGTDHGVGTVAMLAGGAVRGGKVVANWPGLRNLYQERDLLATYDLRQLFKGVIRDHLGVYNTKVLNEHVFPESARTYAIPNLIRT